MFFSMESTHLGYWHSTQWKGEWHSFHTTLEESFCLTIHLESTGKTKDVDLERKNFFQAAEILSEILSKTVIDEHPVECITIPLGQEHVPSTPDPTWVSKHVQQSRHSLQIVMCFDSNCCKPFVTDWPKMFPTRFCPPPLVYKYSENGMVAVEPEKYFKDPKKYKFAPLSVRIILEKYPDAAKKYLKAPFHFYCPSMQDKLENGICKSCGHY